MMKWKRRALEAEEELAQLRATLERREDLLVATQNSDRAAQKLIKVQMEQLELREKQVDLQEQTIQRYKAEADQRKVRTASAPALGPGAIGTLGGISPGAMGKIIETRIQQELTKVVQEADVAVTRASAGLATLDELRATLGLPPEAPTTVRPAPVPATPQQAAELQAERDRIAKTKDFFG